LHRNALPMGYPAPFHIARAATAIFAFIFITPMIR
jgi:hypothetical protein